MNIDINIENKTEHQIPDEKYIKQAIFDIIKEKAIEYPIEIGLKIVDKQEIQKLNAKYRKKDEPTDVLSFPIYEKPPINSEVPVLLGDIIICYEIMANNAKEYGISNEEEFLKLVSHSTLHLLGIHHPGD